MKIQLLRNATLFVEIGGQRLLVDPMFGTAGNMEPVPMPSDDNNKRNPLVELPVSIEVLNAKLAVLDGIVVTHLHPDHWDDEANALLRKDLDLFCQPQDRVRFVEAGFTKATDSKSVSWNGVSIERIGGKHGRGDLAELMGPVSGYVLSSGDQTLYVAGDSVWCEEVQSAIATYEPNVIVLNAGAATFDGQSITMTAEEVLKVSNAAPDAVIICVHLEAMNHCLLSRASLLDEVTNRKLQDRVLVPFDGETLEFQ